jgi:hypothetical protein
VASRYTGAILAPALLFLLWHCLATPDASPPGADRRTRRFLGAAALTGLAALLAVLPMAMKNWWLVGDPLAPLSGPRDAFWVWRGFEQATRNLSWLDVAAYPFVWTFAERSAMLGNISPLVLGAAPLWLIFRGAPLVRSARPALWLGALVVSTWILLEPRSLHTRYLMVGVCLLAIGVAPAVWLGCVELRGTPRGLCRAALLGLLGFWLAASGWTALEALGHVSGRLGPADRYSLKLGWDSTQWVNAHVPHDARVAIRHLVAYPWFLRPDVLRGSESREERQRLYEASGRAEGGAIHPAEWELLSRWGFGYAVLESRWLDASLAAVPAGMARPDVAFEGRETLVLRLR